jgi:hypothetical protein
MKTITTTVYTFAELTDAAKETAREWARGIEDLYGFSEDSRASIEAFCEHFGVTLVAWNIGPWSPIAYKTNAENRHFRGVKLASIDRENMHTGYCLDCDLWQTFYDEFKRTGDAKGAFDSALEVGFKAWRNDWENTYADEQIDEFLIANEYDFTASGKRV